MSTTALHPTRIAPRAGTATPAFWQRLWAALEAHGQRRAAAELRRLAATHVSTSPEVQRALKEAAQRAARY